MEAVKLNVSLKRINSYLNCPDLVEERGRRTSSGSLTKNSVEMRQASFAWSGDTKDSKETTTLSKIDLTVGKGDLVAVVGKIGSGKSSLLAAVLGELTKVKIKVKVSFSEKQICLCSGGRLKQCRGKHLLCCSTSLDSEHDGTFIIFPIH